MLWTSNPTLVVAAVLGGLLLLLVVAYSLSSAGRTAPKAASHDPAPPTWVSTLTSGEEQASLAAEAIESRTQAKLSQHADLAGIRLDFGTGTGGGLEFWVGDERYTSVDEIPDARIRSAISEAVEEFNRGESAGGVS